MNVKRTGKDTRYERMTQNMSSLQMAGIQHKPCRWQLFWQKTYSPAGLHEVLSLKRQNSQRCAQSDIHWTGFYTAMLTHLNLTTSTKIAQRGYTSTIDLGSIFALNSCNIQSMMFFQPSRRISPWRWAKANSVLADCWDFRFLPNDTGRLSPLCEQNHQFFEGRVNSYA